MIVFDLKCAGSGHVFEAWFGSSGDYDDQRTRGLLSCPLCDDSDISKAVMAPSVSSKGNRADSKSFLPISKPEGKTDTELKGMLATLADAQRKALKESTWVGKEFDKQARAMDAGESDKKSIHGEVTIKEAAALVEDGIAVMPLPFPVIPPDQCN
jgi:hypothetical protein